ncbi:uncharacterized protein [Ptychodera flava]|uniref:uncharacterized protein n=1 Tax=Ptychodera flava TaxID=63121 RepID=UPI00396A6A12
MYESGMKTFPVFLIPRVDPDFPTCVNGHDWDTSDPVQMGWILGNATIHKETTSITHSWSEGESKQIQVCYRLCCGTCKCRMFYDGQEDLLFNLNNKDLVHYSLLLNYLHHMLEGRNPLAACHRAFAKNHAVLSNATPLHIQKLRLAWNAFARLLNIDFTSVFQCHTCGPVPDIIICDGTSIGCRKSYLKPYLISQDTPSTEPVRGSQHKDRTLLLQKKTRFALFQYSQTKASLTQGEFNSMISQLRKEKNGKPIADFIILSDDNRQPPNYCRDILKDLSRNSPVCALAQSNDVGRIISLLSQAGSGAISRILSALKREVPIIGDWLYHVTQLYRPLPGCVYDLLLLISRCIAETYNHECDDSVDDNPASSACDDLMYFPALPMLHRNRKYARDVNKPDTDACKKFNRGHPTLSPGIFTLFCPHKICYGFQLLLSHESPEHPFSIFKTRFEVAPKLIVYDNACKLHQYCLNREPVFFQNTIFCVDRLHWKNHKGRTFPNS